MTGPARLHVGTYPDGAASPLHCALLQLGYDIGIAELVDASLRSDTVAALRRFQEAHQLAVTGEVDGASADLLQRERTAIEDRPLYVVGRVHRVDGRPAAGVMVRAVDRDLRREQELGTATTDQAGHWRIAYHRRQFARADKASADLIIRVVERDRTVHDPGVAGSQQRMEPTRDARAHGDFAHPARAWTGQPWRSICPSSRADARLR